MVGPISSEERSTFALKMKLFLVTVIAASAGLIALQGDASLPLLVGAVVVGALSGTLLVWFVFPGSGETVRDDTPRRPR